MPNVQHPINLPLWYPSKKNISWMLALVTCHIFPPQSDTEKMNSWHLTSRLTARSFSESTASRVRSGGNAQPCILYSGKGPCFFGASWGWWRSRYIRSLKWLKCWGLRNRPISYNGQYKEWSHLFSPRVLSTKRVKYRPVPGFGPRKRFWVISLGGLWEG